MDTKKLLTVGAVGIGGWWLYSNWAHLFGGVAVAAAPAPGGIVPASTPMPTTTAAAPASTAAAPATVAPQATLMDMPTLISRLKAAADPGVTALNRDQWDYYRNRIAPPDLTPEQFGLAFPGDARPNISAEEFVAKLHAVGLAGYRGSRTMTGARHLNYRRARRGGVA